MSSEKLGQFKCASGKTYEGKWEPSNGDVYSGPIGSAGQNKVPGKAHSSSEAGNMVAAFVRQK